MDIQLKYYSKEFNIGLADLKNAWFLTGLPVRLNVSVHQGCLCYRLPQDGKRVSYRQLKKGLVKCTRLICLPYEPLPF